MAGAPVVDVESLDCCDGALSSQSWSCVPWEVVLCKVGRVSLEERLGESG